MEEYEVEVGGGERMLTSIVPAALNAEGKEVQRRGEESLVGRDVLGRHSRSPPPRLRASQNSALNFAGKRLSQSV